MKRERESSENLPLETKTYLREIFSVLRVHYSFLSLAGISSGRSRIGFINELSLDVIRFLVDDDEFLYDFANDNGIEDIYQFFWEKKRQVEANKVKLPQYDLVSRKKEILTKLGVVLECGWKVVNEKKDHDAFSYADIPVGWGIQIVRSMLDPLVDKDEVDGEFEKIKNNPSGIVRYCKALYFEIKDLNNASFKLK